MLNVLIVLMGIGVAGRPHIGTNVPDAKSTADTILLQTDVTGRFKRVTTPKPYVPTRFEADYLRDDDNPLQEYEDSRRCCRALTATCLACETGVTVEEYCASHTDEEVMGCRDGQALPTSTHVPNARNLLPNDENARDLLPNDENARDLLPNDENTREALPNDENSSCCKAMTAECLACEEGVTIEAYCSAHRDAVGCMPSARSFPLNGNISINDENNSARCTTREDSRASAMGYTTSPRGTPCVFGADDRDEGSHCIMDDGKYGSFGWCFTSIDRESWGSCNEQCPLFGQAKILAKKIDHLHKAVEDQIKKMDETKTETTTVFHSTEMSTSTTASGRHSGAAGKTAEPVNTGTAEPAKTETGNASGKQNGTAGKIAEPAKTETGKA